MYVYLCVLVVTLGTIVQPEDESVESTLVGQVAEAELEMSSLKTTGFV